MITEETYTDELYSQCYFNQPGLVNEEQITSWKKVVDAVDAAGSSIVDQLEHAGALIVEQMNTVDPLKTGYDSWLKWLLQFAKPLAPILQ
ncbi:oxidoreductase [Paenibacillus polymyxa]|uniref:oxidoreductase n=1 Tax=Paenibacillus polymyxa TaxID=1406 RepID=UPI00358DA78C